MGRWYCFWWVREIPVFFATRVPWCSRGIRGVYSIERSLVDFILPRTPITKVVASGGGTRNATLMRDLGERLANRGVKLCVSDEFGLPAVFKEAIKFATLAYACKWSLANNIPACGGAEKFAVLGKLSLAPRLARLGEETAEGDGNGELLHACTRTLRCVC